MPAQSLTSERYVVYSVDGTDDLKSNSSGSRESVTFTSPEYVDLALRKLPNGRGHDNLIPSPVPSTPTIDKWGSYWSNRERCCCFWNFVMFVTIVVLATIVILVSKGMMDLRKPNKDSTISNERFSSADVTLTAVTCASPKPEPKMCTDDMCLRLTTDILKQMDLRVDPCQDFYTYACGGFTKTATVTWSSPRYRINPDVIIQKHFAEILDAVSEDTTEQDSKETIAVKTIFQSCVHHTDTSTSQVVDVFNDLGGFEWGASGPTDMTKPMTLTQLITETAVRFGTFVLFDVDVNSDKSLGIYNRFSDGFIQRRMEERMSAKRYRFLKPSDYIYRDENKDETLQAYKTYIGDFLSYILGINGTVRADRRFTAMIDDIYHLDVYINRVLYTEDSGNLSDGFTRCQNKMTIDDIQYQFSYNISWRQVFDTVFQDNNKIPKTYNICYVSLTNALSDVLAEFTFKSVKHYIFFSLLVNSELFSLLPPDTPVFKMSQWTSSAFRKDHGHGVVGGDDTQCVHLLSNYIPISHVIQPRIPTELENEMTSLFDELVSSTEGIISDMYWVPATQKRHLLTALSDLEIQFEWNKQTRVFGQMVQNVTSDFFHNFINMLRYESHMFWRGYKQRMYSADESSVFYLNSRTLEVPSSALQIPLVDTFALPSTWYGTTGTLLSETISELFDIDALLRLLTEDKIDHRVALTIAFRLQCLVDEYKKYVVYKDADSEYKVKSDITKSANFGDSLALRVAYNAYTKHRKTVLPPFPGLSFTNDQLFFLTYAQTMCEKSNKRGLFKHYIDVTEPHTSPGKYRVLGTLSNFKKFAEAYNCDANSYMNPQDKCTLF